MAYCNSINLLESGKINFRQFGLYRYLRSIEAQGWQTTVEKLARLADREPDEIREDLRILEEADLLELGRTDVVERAYI